MTQLVIVTADINRFAEFSAALESLYGTVLWAANGERALAMLAKEAVDLVVVDENLGDMAGLTFVERLVTVNPLINSAVVSSLPKGDFHEASEGLGVLMALPPEPDKSDAKRLAAHLDRITGITGKATN